MTVLRERGKSGIESAPRGLGLAQAARMPFPRSRNTDRLEPEPLTPTALPGRATTHPVLQRERGTGLGFEAVQHANRPSCTRPCAGSQRLRVIITHPTHQRFGVASTKSAAAAYQSPDRDRRRQEVSSLHGREAG